MKIIKNLSNNFLFLAIFFIFFIKIIIFFLIKSKFFSIQVGGDGDSSYYNAYALGKVDSAVNFWPIILKFLNELGLYSRDGVSYALFFLNLLIIPIFTAKISGLSYKYSQKFFLYCLLLCLIYPTLFFYTFDVYRDVFMVFSFLIGCLVIKKSLKSSNFLSFFILYILALSIGYFLLILRPYLGYAFLASLVLFNIRFTKKRLIIFGILYALILFFINYIGALDRLTDYRSGFENQSGGSTLGLNFSNPIMFLPNLFLSLLGQLLGLYMTNSMAVALFIIETIPFIFMFFYIIKNIEYSDSFIRFLIIFFVMYASVWLIGNDNLGTAVRLRLYNYFAIYICFFHILMLKKEFLNKDC